jgi:hypothetical protein
MAVDNINALSDEVIERRALEPPKRADAKRRQSTADNDPLTKADCRAAYNLLAGWDARDRRGRVHRLFLQEGTEGEICARHAMGRLLRRLANSPLDDELAAILILLAGHFDGKIGYRNVSNLGLYKSKLPRVALAAERRLRFEVDLLTDVQQRSGLTRVKKAWLQLRSKFQGLISRPPVKLMAITGDSGTLLRALSGRLAHRLRRSKSISWGPPDSEQLASISGSNLHQSAEDGP